MSRIGELYLPDRLAPMLPRWLTEIAVGLACAGAGILCRLLLDLLAPGGAPFVLVYPAAILATLFARWRAGALTAVLLIGYIKYYAYPVIGSFQAADRAGVIFLVAIVVGITLTIGIAEFFGQAARRATDERDREIADRDLLLTEFDHRMKNNFAIVVSILDLQRRRTEGDAAEALGVALHRVESIARAHRHLYRGRGDTSSVMMGAYLSDLCDALSDALFLRGGITLQCFYDDVAVPRDRAVSIGLVVNELVTNAAKHAFAGREGGVISVTFRDHPGGWTLIVSDDGVGMGTGEGRPATLDSGLGSRLIPAFARQAGGTIATESGPDGTTVTLEIPV